MQNERLGREKCGTTVKTEVKKKCHAARVIRPGCPTAILVVFRSSAPKQRDTQPPTRDIGNVQIVEFHKVHKVRDDVSPIIAAAAGPASQQQQHPSRADEFRRGQGTLRPGVQVERSPLGEEKTNLRAR